jgi:hypothetical protein
VNSTQHILPRFLQPQNLLALVLLLFRDFIDDFPQALKLQVGSALVPSFTFAGPILPT